MERKRIGIFISVYHNIDKFKNCMDSLLSSDLSNHDVAIFVGFNGGYEDAADYILEVNESLKSTPIIFHTVLPSANIGKGKLINLMSNYCENLDYLVSVDGDIEFTCVNWLDLFIESYDVIEDHRVAALAPNQLGHHCHLFNSDFKIENLSNGFHFAYNKGNCGTAGGLFFIPIAVWKELGGYKGHRVYASDDGNLCYDANLKGYRVGVIPEIEVFHPFETDQKYIDWKLRCARNQLKDEEKNGYFEQEVI
jgi:hypothetical protein